MPRTPVSHAPAVGVLRDAGRALLAGLAAGGVCAMLIVALGWQAGLRGWFGLTPERPVAIGPRELWLDNARTLLWPFLTAAVVTWTPRTRPFFDLALVAVLGGNVLLVAAALAAYGGPLWRLAPGHYALELLAVAAATSAYLDARRDGVLRRRLLLGCGATPALLPATAALLESGAASPAG